MPEPLPDDVRYALPQIKAAFWAMWLTFFLPDAWTEQYISHWWEDFTTHLSGAHVTSELPKAWPLEGEDA